MLGLIAGGCTNISPGDVTDIQPMAAPQQPRVGNAYLFRGFIGVFSTGMNTLGDELNAQGVRTLVFQADQWTSVADTIEQKYRSTSRAEPVVLVGHSYGADNVIRIAQKLKESKVRIDLLITLDPVTPPKVPSNVAKVVNLYQNNGAWDTLPWLRGIPLEAERPGSVMLVNQDIRTQRIDLLDDDLNHFNIEKQKKIHAEVIKRIKEVCVTRSAWASRAPQLAPVIPILNTKARPPTTAPVQAKLN